MVSDTDSAPNVAPERIANEQDGYIVLSRMLAGPIFYGAVGWGLDQWFGTNWLVLLGATIGIALSVALVAVGYARQSQK